jgi:hypothetical protein
MPLKKLDCTAGAVLGAAALFVVLYGLWQWSLAALM